ncbi:acetyl-CoA carboxylase biotin carboxylase subunit family protein [Mesorhizobium sp.]|uniref:ATP-grasp domain-containing protein n=1 Tax=Mesorhizobium sp. TaxID=1871066 RepID=UPI000FE45B43|nr:acetyl-CoA carboxylase biotin carboxylase subunit family protein [Mesorhizobium sp.]RWK11068.1 MAG: ATP-grasp domain-containing protein [Mesorhizobium sp.]TIQ44811.1 MAG: ATP-grasp domain-containing protein [Mesorhizobium sp.]TIQ59515.1 MAG: ATP-grasp domain-containing protein [Mesorhizobium sp.]TJV92581.1 MAG: ATP-grasp domain-containing protein [Mesorhizobium sp.]
MARRALILVEGASNILGYIQASRRLDLHPIILSADPRCEYLEAEETEVLHVDTDDLDALMRVCCRLRATYDIAGITSAKEAVYATVGKLCRYFGLPGPNPESIERCCDKFTQRQLLAEAGVPIPAYRSAGNATDVENAAAQIGLPVIVKPAVGISSCGVRLCRRFDELAEHTNYLLGGEHIWRSAPRILVEEFAQGPLYSAEIMGNEIIGICAAELGAPPHFVYRECTYPALLSDDEHERIADVSRSCLRALGLGWGPTGIEFRWTTRGPIVIEVNPRLHGRPTPHLVHLAYGVDLIAAHIKLAIGEEWHLREGHSQTAAARFLIPDRDGILDWIDGDTRAAAVPGVAEVRFHVKPKAPIVRRGDQGDSMGYVLAASPTRARTEAILQRAMDLIQWSISPFPILGESEESASLTSNARQLEEFFAHRPPEADKSR